MRGDMPGKLDIALTVVVLVIVAVVGVMVLGSFDAGDASAFYDRAEEWCDEEGGELYNAMVIGSSGGLHCDGIGEHVHMTDVAALNWTHDTDAIHERYDSRTGPLGIVGWGVYGMLGVIVAGVLGAYGIGWYHRREE